MLADLDAIAHALAQRVHRAVAIDDPSLRLLAHTPHHGPVDETRRQSIMHLRADTATVEWALGIVAHATEDLVRLPANQERGVLARVCAPLRWQGRTLGYLWLIDQDGTLTDEELAEVAEAARAASRVMARGGLPPDSHQLLLESLTEDLFVEAAAVRRQAAQSLTQMLELSGPVSTIAFELDRECPQGDITALQRHLQRVASRHSAYPALPVAANDRVVLLLADPRPRVVARIADSALESTTPHGLPVLQRAGIGDPVGELEDVWLSRRQAEGALRVVTRTGKFGRSAAWPQIGVYRILDRIDPSADLSELLPQALWQALHEPAHADIIATVEVYLDHGSDVQRAIEVLRIHRTSLYYRLRRFTEVTGLDLRDGQVRLAVHAGLALARLRTTA